jgi:hypothetical protein
MDTLHDHLSTLNEDTPRIKVSSDSPITSDLAFGLDTQLFSKQGEEGVDWEKIAGNAGGWHGDEVETKTIWRGGKKPGTGTGKEHVHKEGEDCVGCTKGGEGGEVSKEVISITKETLETALSKLSFEIYRGMSLFSYHVLFFNSLLVIR